MSDHYLGGAGSSADLQSATVDANGVEFMPSARFSVDADGVREVCIAYLGDSFVAGYGDPKAQGWVGRVAGRTELPLANVTHYPLGVRGNTSAQVAVRFETEVMPRFDVRSERRLVLSLGYNDVAAGITLARQRLTLANVLDKAENAAIASFVVSPPPSLDPSVNEVLIDMVAAQRETCVRRSVPFVDIFTPLVGHEQWVSDLASSRDGVHPGQAGYGLMAWLVLNSGWHPWLNPRVADQG